MKLEKLITEIKARDKLGFVDDNQAIDLCLSLLDRNFVHEDVNALLSDALTLMEEAYIIQNGIENDDYRVPMYAGDL